MSQEGPVKRFKGWCVVAMLLMANLSYAEVVDRIVAVVNDEIITLSDLNNVFDPYRKKIEEAYRGEERDSIITESRMALLNKLIDAALIDQEAKRNKISVGEEELMTTIKDILARRNVSLEDFMKGLSAEGKSLETYKKDMREQMIRMQMIRKEIKSKVIVTDEEIGEYYRTHRTDYEGREAVRVKQIFLAFPKDADEATMEKLKKDADDIVIRLKNGEPFDALTAYYSQGPAGGDLGFIEKGMMALPEVEKAAFDMEVGRVSGVIQSRAGFHIIMVVDKKGGGLKSIEIVRGEIQSNIEEQKLAKKFEEWLDALRKKSHIEIKL
jgi:peptidyl-prolyl cis-trans isomerase SurA